MSNKVTTQPDPPEAELRLNDHVLVTYTKEGPTKWWDDDHHRDNYHYDLYVLVTIGDCSISYYISGELCTPLEDWMLHDISVDIGRLPPETDGDSLAFEDFENIDVHLKHHGNETLRTWVKMAREKGKF